MPLATPKDPTPDYSNPPLIETVLGIQFDRLSGLKNAHLGAFWKTLDTDQWPTISDAPLLPPQFEQFTEAPTWAKGVIQLTQETSSRLQVKNKDGNRMIQVQNGRLHFNWIREAAGEYPRYAKVREGFVRVFQQFLDFIVKEKIGDFRPNQWEVTYVNHIPRNTVWRTPNDWEFFRLLGSLPTIENLVQGESFTGEWHFVIPQQHGRLHVGWQHSLKSASDKEEQEFIRLTFTARGSLQENKDDHLQAVFEGLDLGREIIVRSFKECMSDDANKYWGLKHATA